MWILTLFSSGTYSIWVVRTLLPNVAYQLYITWCKWHCVLTCKEINDCNSCSVLLKISINLRLRPMSYSKDCHVTRYKLYPRKFQWKTHISLPYFLKWNTYTSSHPHTPLLQPTHPYTSHTHPHPKRRQQQQTPANVALSFCRTFELSWIKWLET